MALHGQDKGILQDFHIEIASVDSISSIAMLWIKASNERLHAHSSKDASDVEDLIRERMHEPDASFLLAKDMDTVIGIGHHLPARQNDGAGDEVIPGLVHLSMIAVEPAYWGLGIGKAVTSYCVERSSELGYEAMQLWTHASNERAQRLYASLGFGYAGREKMDDHGERIKLYRRMLFR